MLFQLAKIRDKPNSQYKDLVFTAAGKHVNIICYNGKMVIPKSLQPRIVEWYHSYLSHPGLNRTEETIGQHLWWPKILQLQKLVPFVNGTRSNAKNMVIFPPKRQKLRLGTDFVWISLDHTKSDVKENQHLHVTVWRWLIRQPDSLKCMKWQTTSQILFQMS